MIGVTPSSVCDGHYLLIRSTTAHPARTGLHQLGLHALDSSKFATVLFKSRMATVSLDLSSSTPRPNLHDAKLSAHPSSPVLKADPQNAHGNFAAGRERSSQPTVLARLQALFPSSGSAPSSPGGVHHVSDRSATHPPPHFLKIRIVTWNMHDSLPKVSIVDILRARGIARLEQYSSTFAGQSRRLARGCSTL